MSLHPPPLHSLVTDGSIIGEVSRRHGSRVHVLVGYVITHRRQYGNQYEAVEYGYGNHGTELTRLQACHDCGQLFPHSPNADRCPACVAEQLGEEV